MSITFATPLVEKSTNVSDNVYQVESQNGDTLYFTNKTQDRGQYANKPINFICEICGNGYNLKKGLDKHMRSKHA